MHSHRAGYSDGPLGGVDTSRLGVYMLTYNSVIHEDYDYHVSLVVIITTRSRVIRDDHG